MNIEADKPVNLDPKQIAEDARDLRNLLSEGTVIERKIFLRSFVKRIDYEPNGIKISYTLPMRMESDQLVSKEVLSMESNGEPCGSRTHDHMIKSIAEEF